MISDKNGEQSMRTVLQISPRSYLAYSVGALLYAPAINDKIVRSILEQKIREPYSASLCLEDSIHCSSVEHAEQNIVRYFFKIMEAKEREPGLSLPKLFIRVRRPEQIPDLFRRLGGASELLTGFIAPKYSLRSAESYNRSILSVNRHSHRPVYMMPTLESSDILRLQGRGDALQYLRDQVDLISDFILNIRVGGNDFCNAFGVRRSVDETVYDNLAVSSILSDILTVFSPDYVVSGPVWEYFSGDSDAWRQGLLRELKLDKLNGFIGKTVIHPNQIPVVNQALAVSPGDYEDAVSILNWSADNGAMVGKNRSGERMNEVTVHGKWAQKILILSDIYGIAEPDPNGTDRSRPQEHKIRKESQQLYEGTNPRLR